MSSEEVSNRIAKLFRWYWHRYWHRYSFVEFVKSVPDLIIEFKSSILVIIIWVLVSEISGYHMVDIFRSIFKIIIYPLNWVLYRTNFDLTGIPVIFLLLMPLVIFIVITFLILISTED